MITTAQARAAVRDALLEQEIDRVKSKLEHYTGRLRRGTADDTADDEDKVAHALYTRILGALEGMAASQPERCDWCGLSEEACWNRRNGTICPEYHETETKTEVAS